MPEKLKIRAKWQSAQFWKKWFDIFLKMQYSNDIRSAFEDILCTGGTSRVFQIT